MSFYSWMIQSHINDSTVVGAVARAMTTNKHMFRRVRSYTKARACLDQLSPCQEYLDAFDRAWNEYQKHQLERPDA